jgi:hypothetical protein
MLKRVAIISGIIVLLLAVILGIPPIRRFILYKTPVYKLLPSRSGSAADSAQVQGNTEMAAFTEPDLERIKTDLIGKQIPGWSFDSKEEFRKAVITSVARSDLRIDFRLDLSLQAVTGNDRGLYDAQLFATYLPGDEDWYLDRLMLIFIAFDIEVPPGKWLTVWSVPACSMQPDPKIKLEWTSKTWDYAILTGPEYESVTLPPAENYEVRNKAKKPVTVRLTFRPAE